jgi:thrombospondin type 3 repeat protein
MKLGSLVFVTVLAWMFGACGPASTGGDGGGDDDMSTTDSDGDGISDADEGRATNRDTDGDGTPDYLDDDSDNDGIPDYREAGDAKLDTPPVDSDGDGTPDYLDLDSDNNGRPDGMDGTDDFDGDGIADFQDLDDDNDGIWDIDEIGPNALAPVDTDGDGIPDYHDTDSDNDGILDLYETAADFDNDGIPNFRDTDSDGDCIPDSVEARGNPPVDSDGDTRPDFLDRDSDNDGVLDRMEDKNCNGTVDTGETNPINGDTDGDGVSDLVEVAAGTDPTDPASNPQANGDFVFVEPYTMPQTPLDSNLDFKTKLQAVDMYVMLDRSGSMATEITAVKANLSTVVNQLTCAPLGSGTPPNCIPDLWAGAGSIGYHGAGTEAFHHFVDLQPNPSFAVVPTNEPSSTDTQEPLVYAAYAAVTGTGGAGFGMPSVPSRASCAGSPAQNAGFGTFGYPCFRASALPVVLLATDEAPISPGDTWKSPTWVMTQPIYVSTKARLVGILGSGASASTLSDLNQMATESGAIDASMGNAPLVFDGTNANAPTAIKNGMLALANGLPLDINAVAADDPADAVNAVTAFVDHLETLQLGTAQCANGLNDIDTNGDAFKDKYVQVRTGTPVCWKVVSKQNTTVMPTDQPQLFRATITVFGDGVTQLDQRDVFFLVPPKPVDGPIM